MPPPLPLTSPDILQYRQDGCLVVRGLFAPEEISELNARLSEIARSCDRDGRHALPGVSLEFEAPRPPLPSDAAERELMIRKYHDLGQADPVFWGHLRDPRLRGILTQLIGPGAKLLQCMALVKPPAIGSAKDWHQDIAYFPLTPAAAIGIWIACDDADLENGCMQVIPGTHRLGLQPHVKGPTGWRIEASAVQARAADIRATPMGLGSVLLFDSALWHFTDVNRSQRRRRAIQYHYVAQGTEISGGRELWSLDGAFPPRAGVVPASLDTLA